MNAAGRDEPLFIGWAETPPPDRRTFTRVGLALTVASAAMGLGLSRLVKRPGPGRWDPDAVRAWRGQLVAAPYPLLRLTDGTGTIRNLLLCCEGKCGVAARLGPLDGARVVVRGSLVERGAHGMIAVEEGPDWVRPDTEAAFGEPLATPQSRVLQTVELRGEILDAKCWFGAMRPSEGTVHRGCAALCIRGGIPPAFFARGPQGQQALMILSDGGRAHGPGLLPWVGTPVRVTGRLRRQDDLLWLDVPVTAIGRA